MATQADIFRQKALSEVGHNYNMGEEPWYDDTPDKDPYDTDCSGLYYGCMRKANVTWKGKTFPRYTANDYYHMGNRISKPTNVGDYAVLLDAGTDHAHHIILYVGKNQTVEAKGKAWGVVASTVAAVNPRGAIWCRLPGIALGLLSDEIVIEVKEHPSLSGLFLGDGKGHYKWVNPITREDVDLVLQRHIERDHNGKRGTGTIKS